MASIVALKQFPAVAGGVPFTVRPGDVFVSTDFSSTDYAALVAAGAAQPSGNGFVSFDSPGAGLTAARAAVVELRARGGLDPDGGNGSIMMLDGYLADADGRAVSTGTATLVASTVTVTVPTPPGGEVPVPVGALVYATVQVMGGIPKMLSAVRISDTQITISSPGEGYGPLLEINGANGTLVAGTVDIVLANVPDDRLSVILVNDNGGTPGVLSVKRKNGTEVTVESWQEPVAASGTLVAGTVDIALNNAVGDELSVRMTNANGGTPGVLSVKRKNATEVTVESWLVAVGLQVLDISDVEVVNHGASTNPDVSDVRVYDFGQPFEDTSTVRWAVVRP